MKFIHKRLSEAPSGDKKAHIVFLRVTLMSIHDVDTNRVKLHSFYQESMCSSQTIEDVNKTHCCNFMRAYIRTFSVFENDATCCKPEILIFEGELVRGTHSRIS